MSTSTGGEQDEYYSQYLMTKYNYSRYSTPRGKTDKLEEPVKRELNVTRS